MPIMHCLYRQTVNRNQKTRPIKYFGSLGFLILQNIFFVVGLTYGCRKSWKRTSGIPIHLEVSIHRMVVERLPHLVSKDKLPRIGVSTASQESVFLLLSLHTTEMFHHLSRRFDCAFMIILQRRKVEDTLAIYDTSL